MVAFLLAFDFNKIFLKLALHSDEFLKLIKEAKINGLTISMDPQYDWNQDSENNEYLNKILPLLDVFIPSSYEAYGITKKDDIKESIKALRKMMPRGLIIIKNGEYGVDFSTENDIDGTSTNVPAFKVQKIVDTNGSGSCFIAGFLHKWVQKKNEYRSRMEEKEFISNAISYGCAAAKLSVEKIGAYVYDISKEIVDNIVMNYSF